MESASRSEPEKSRDVESRIAQRLAELHRFGSISVESMKVVTDNSIFSVRADDRSCVLKLFKVAGNHRSGQLAEHVAYEEKVVSGLRSRGMPIAAILRPEEGANATVEGLPALLFERIPGEAKRQPEYQMEAICAALARIHSVQIERALNGVPEGFPYDETCMIWLKAFEAYRKKGQQGAEIDDAFATLAPMAQAYFAHQARAALFARSPWVHCHGDVTPKNVIVGESGDARFFDFGNGFYGPRMADVVDGAFEFSLAEKYIHLADFSRFDKFVELYSAHCTLSTEEWADLPKWTALVGVIKFAKEVRVRTAKPNDQVRQQRALAIARFLQ